MAVEWQNHCQYHRCPSESNTHRGERVHNLVFNGQFPDQLGKPVPECQTVQDLAAARDRKGSVGDNQNCKMYKAPVKSPPSTHQHSVLLQAGWPFCRQTTVSELLKASLTVTQ